MNRLILAATLMLLAAIAGCGDDDEHREVRMRQEVYYGEVEEVSPSGPPTHRTTPPPRRIEGEVREVPPGTEMIVE